MTESKDLEDLQKKIDELKEAAKDMLDLLIANKPIDGLYLSDIEKWDALLGDRG